MALSLSFNRPGTSFVVAHDAGFAVYSAADAREYQIELPTLGFPVRCAAMMDDHPYVATARHMSEEVELWDCRTRAKVHTFCSMPNKQVRSLTVTTTRTVVVCKATTIVFDSDDARRLSEYETAANESGLCALGSDMIAIPGRTAGQVQVVALGDAKVKHVFPAHRSALGAIEVSGDARYVATANEDGTIFRIFALPEQVLVKQLRRGLDRAAIYSMRMSPDNAFLAATSSNGTLHIFTLAHQPTPDDGYGDYGEEGSGGGSSLRKAGEAKSRATAHGDEESGGPRSSVPSDAPQDDFDMIEEDAPSAPNSKQPAGPRYGVLGKLPFAPSILKDQYPNASMKFDKGFGEMKSSPQEISGRHPSGQVAWLDEKTLVVARVKPACLWEKFRVRNAVDEWKVERITSRSWTLAL